MADNDRHFELYFQALSQWGTPDELNRILRWMSPAELEAILRAAGSPDDVLRTVQMLRSIIKRQEQWEWARSALAEWAKWIAGVGAAIAVLRALFPDLFAWWGK